MSNSTKPNLGWFHPAPDSSMSSRSTNGVKEETYEDDGILLSSQIPHATDTCTGVKHELQDSCEEDAYGDVSFAEMFGLDEFIVKQEPTVKREPMQSPHIQVSQLQSAQPRASSNNGFSSQGSRMIRTVGPRTADMFGSSTPRKRNQKVAAASVPMKRAKLTPSSNESLSSIGQPSEIGSLGLSASVKPQANVSGGTSNSADPDLTIQYSFLCSYCSFISAHKTSVRRHIGTTHASIPDVDVNNIGEKELFLCKYCSFNSNHRSSVKRHVGTLHGGEKVVGKESGVGEVVSTLSAGRETAELKPGVASGVTVADAIDKMLSGSQAPSYSHVPSRTPSNGLASKMKVSAVGSVSRKVSECSTITDSRPDFFTANSSRFPVPQSTSVNLLSSEHPSHMRPQLQPGSKLNPVRPKVSSSRKKNTSGAQPKTEPNNAHDLDSQTSRLPPSQSSSKSNNSFASFSHQPGKSSVKKSIPNITVGDNFSLTASSNEIVNRPLPVFKAEAVDGDATSVSGEFRGGQQQTSTNILPFVSSISSGSFSESAPNISKDCNSVSFSNSSHRVPTPVSPMTKSQSDGGFQSTPIKSPTASSTNFSMRVSPAAQLFPGSPSNASAISPNRYHMNLMNNIVANGPGFAPDGSPAPMTSYSPNSFIPSSMQVNPYGTPHSPSVYAGIQQISSPPGMMNSHPMNAGNMGIHQSNGGSSILGHLQTATSLPNSYPITYNLHNSTQMKFTEK